jgi:TolB-like protein/Tfp pilus assembly protein PilF
MKRFFAELKRRKVLRVAIAYAVGAWLLIQIATQVFPFFEIPTWAVRLVIVVLIIGFPIAMVLSWIFDLTPHGLRRTDEVDQQRGARLQTPTSDLREIPEKSIAVLPFENLGGDKENDYFAAGVHDDILSNLARIADLKVISRTSVQQFKGETRNLREIAGALGVAHVLEGTARRVGNRVRVNAQLIDARTDSHIWGETFDREITDLFALQSELAERITYALRANLSPREKTVLHEHATRDVAAWELYLRARTLFHWAGSGDSHDSGGRALQLLEEAIARDPQFAAAHALASRLHSELFWFGYDKSAERLEKAKAAAETALRIHSNLGEAHLAYAVYQYFGFRRYDEARRHIVAALRVSPNDSEVLNTAGAIDRRQGRWEEAIANMQKARQLDPRNLSVFWNLLETYLALHRYDEAERVIVDALKVSPTAYFFALARGALPLFQSGDMAPLCAALEKIPADFDPGGAVTTIAVRVHLMERDYDAAERALSSCAHVKLNDNGLSGTAGALDDYNVPRAWYMGLIARGRGDDVLAQNAFESARRAVERELSRASEDAKVHAMLALIQAARFENAEALKTVRQAAELLPIARDAFDGPMVMTTLAVVAAQTGEKELALEQLQSLVGIPNGPTAGTLKIEPEWDRLRGDARFEKLIIGR